MSERYIISVPKGSFLLKGDITNNVFYSIPQTDECHFEIAEKEGKVIVNIRNILITNNEYAWITMVPKWLSKILYKFYYK